LSTSAYAHQDDDTPYQDFHHQDDVKQDLLYTSVPTTSINSYSDDAAVVTYSILTLTIDHSDNSSTKPQR
jgi:hypothetical protein